FFFFFSSRRRHTRSKRDWSSDVCSSDLLLFARDEALVLVRPAPPACAVCAVPSWPASHHQPKQSKDAVLRVLDARNRLKPSPGHLNSYEESRSVVRRPFGSDTKRRGAECEVSLDTFLTDKIYPSSGCSTEMNLSSSHASDRTE